VPSPLTTYIGFTNDPLKRLRQHNGEIVSGARRTHKKRPWEMLAVLSGFPTQVSALQFVRSHLRRAPFCVARAPPPHRRPRPRAPLFLQEWAWQHPTSSKAVRDHVRGLPSRGAPAKLQVLLVMLQIEPWSQLPLRLHFAGADVAAVAAAFPRQPPPHVAARTSVGPISDMWIYADAARLLAAARAAKAEERAAKAGERAAARALKKAGRAKRPAKGGGGGGSGDGGGGEGGIYDSPSASVASSWEEADGSSLGSLSEPEEGARGGGGEPRRSSLHRFRVRRVSEEGAAAAVEEDVEVIEIGSDSEGEEAGAARAPPGSAEEGDVVEVVDEDEGGVVELGDEGLDEGEVPPSQGGLGEEVADAMLPLAERLRRRIGAEGWEAAAGGGPGPAAPAAAAAAAAAAESAPCACCKAPVAVGEPSGMWLRCGGCGATAHASCLADHFIKHQHGGAGDAVLLRIVPTPAPVPCPARGCAQLLTWPLLVEEALRRGLAALDPAQLRRAIGLEPYVVAARGPKRKRR